jgi:hypothetical protein
MPATRPTDLQQWQFVMPRAGWVDVEIPLGGEEGQSLSFLHNFRVCRDGLETTIGWRAPVNDTVGSSTNQPGAFLGVVSVPRPDGVICNFYCFERRIYMSRLAGATREFFNVTPSGWTGNVLTTVPDITFFQNRFYMAVPHATHGGVYVLNPDASTPVWTLISGSPKAETIGTLGFRLVVGNTVNTSGGAVYRIHWSGLNNPDTWDSLQTIDLPLYDTIIRFLPFAENILVVTQNRFYILSYTGNPQTPFAVSLATTLPAQIKDKRQVQSIMLHDVSMVVYAIDSGLYAFSGNESMLLSQNIDKTFRNTAVNADRLIIAYNPIDAEIYCIPHGTSFADHCLVYQVLFRTWYRRDRPAASQVFMGIENFSHDDRIAVPIFVTYNSSNFTLQTYKLRMPYEDVQKRDNATFNGEIHIPASEIGPPGGQKTLVSILLWWTIQGVVADITGNWEINVAVSHSLPRLTNPNTYTYQLLGSLPVSGTSEEVGVHQTGRYIRARIVASGFSTRVVWHGIFVFWH